MKISKSYKEQVNEEFSELSTNQEKWDYLRNLISKNYFDYFDIKKIFNISKTDSVKTFKKLDLKVCVEKENCINPNGPVLSCESFRKDNSRYDGLKGKCKECWKKKYNEYENYRRAISKLNSEEKLDFIRKIIVNYNYNYQNISAILNCETSKVIQIFQKLNLKICSNNDCSSPYGRAQSRENFNSNDYMIDNLANECRFCAEKYRKDNFDYLQEYEKKRRLKNYEERIQRDREYYRKNRERILKKHQEYEQRPANYKRFVDRLSNYEETRKDPTNEEYLQVKCALCFNWFTPTMNQVANRLGAIEGRNLGENHFYCSDFCKNSCPVYKQKKYRRDEKPITINREVQPELRELVFERDNYSCIKCGSINNLNCHHVEGIQWEPIESADIDKCITVCEDCHKEIHQIPGCTYQDMQCN